MIIILEKNNKLECIKYSSIQSVLFSISRFKYFYNKEIIIGDMCMVFTGIDLNYYDTYAHIKVEEIEFYTNIELKKNIEFKVKEKTESKITPQVLYDLFLYEYFAKFRINYTINNKFNYLNKFRKLMDQFYSNGLKDLHIRNYIRRCIKFGNHKGDPVYIDFIFNDKVLQNYFLYIKGIKDITLVWPYLDTTLSNIEKKQIRYLMNLKLFDNFSNIEKDLCCKFYKKYNKKIYEQLLEKYKPKDKIMAKREVFNIISNNYGITMQELLIKTKHKLDYFYYDFTQIQIKEALK